VQIRSAYKHLGNYAGTNISFETVSADWLKKIEALLTSEMKQIIERWGNSDKNPENYVFPFLDGYNTPMEQKKRVQDITRSLT
jgi:hypothetical protein